MLNEAKELQKNAVAKLREAVLSENNNIVFKAPTGSGKTWMMADMINQLLEDPNILKNQQTSIDGVVFLVSSLSKGNLAKQNYEKFCEYGNKQFFPKLKPYLINSEVAGEERLFIPTDYNVYFLARDLYRNNARLMQGCMKNFLLNIIAPKNVGGQGKIIILVKDECHIATRNLDDLSGFFTKVINFSATPNLRRGQQPTVEISENDAVRAKLIKAVNWQEDGEGLKTAIDKYVDVKKEYLKHLGINPCLIIQISNEDRQDAELAEIKQILNEKPELKWMLIVDKEKDCDTNDELKSKKLPVSKWKDYAKENTSTIDIIIFKMVITEGWDIPRACMLYQIRDVQSTQLNEQVIGRIRRNPRLIDYETLSADQQDLAMKSWVWGVHNTDDTQHWNSVVLQYASEKADIKIKTTKLKPLEGDFNIQSFVENLNKPNFVPSSIFYLGREIRKMETELQNTLYSYATDYQKWWKLAEHTNDLKREYYGFICKYEDSMEVVQENGKDKEVSFPVTSQYLGTDFTVTIENSVWVKKERNDLNKCFSFDSEAEKMWAEILQRLSNNFATVREDDLLNKVCLWGKNYLPNSEIKFEYYLNGIHSSYPDFIVKDKSGVVHIFEVKSINTSQNNNIDSEEYKRKIEALQKAYKQASKLTKHIFYIPVLGKNTWAIYRYTNGEDEVLNREQFEQSFKIDN